MSCVFVILFFYDFPNYYLIFPASESVGQLAAVRDNTAAAAAVLLIVKRGCESWDVMG